MTQDSNYHSTKNIDWIIKGGIKGKKAIFNALRKLIDFRGAFDAPSEIEKWCWHLGHTKANSVLDTCLLKLEHPYKNL